MMDDSPDSARRDMGCLQAIEALYAYLDGEMDSAGVVSDFERHMAHCRSCYSRAQMEGLLTRHLKAQNRVQAPDELRARLRRMLGRY